MRYLAVFKMWRMTLTNAIGMLLLGALAIPANGWAGAGPGPAQNSMTEPMPAGPGGLRGLLKAQAQGEPASGAGLNPAQRRELRAQIRAQAFDGSPGAKSKFSSTQAHEGR
jgi:hypothetical protein